MIAATMTTQETLDDILAGCNVEARNYQIRMINKVFDYHDLNGVKSILIESPTGSGKTVLATVLCRLLEERFNYKCGWMAMNRSLLAQTKVCNETKNINANLTYISMFDKNPPTDIDVLVHDECQHDASNSAAHVHNKVRPKLIIGLTATPFRTDRVKLCFEKIIKDIGISQLIKAGYLSPYNHYAIPAWNPEAVADCYANDPIKWGKTICFFRTEIECYRCQLRLAFHGIHGEVVTGKTDRESQLAAFTEGVFPVMIGIRTIAEGIDQPDLKTVFVRDGSRGPTIQMSGRVFRPFHGIAQKQVVQSKQTKWPMVRTALPFEQWVWESEQWRSIKLNPKINKIIANNTVSMAKTEVFIPDFIKTRSKRKRKWRSQ